MALIYAGLFLLCLLLSALFAASETAFIAANPFKLRLLEEKGSRRARLSQKMKARVDKLLATILIGNTLVNIAAASIVTYLAVILMPHNKNQAVIVATALTTLLILLFGEIGPKTMAAYRPLKFTMLLVYPVRLFFALFYPLSRMFTGLVNLFLPSSAREKAGLFDLISEEEMRLMIMSGTKNMPVERQRMLSGVLAISNRTLREIMTPRPQIKAIEISTPPAQILETIMASEFSRYPVFRGRMENIEGILHVKEVLPYLVENKPFHLPDLLRPALFLPESASLETALREMRSRAMHLVVVVDEFGSVEGIVTLEDILEEIVGEIRDESDDLSEEEWLEKKEEEAYLLRGRAPIKEIKERLGIDLPENKEYTTLAGFLLFHFGRLPQEKEHLDYGPYRFTVEKIIRRHLSLIKIELKEREKDHENTSRK